MGADLETVKSYINAPKYKKAREWYSFDFSQYEPHIKPHQKMKKHLYCALTGITLPMNPTKVQEHVKSSRFQELKKEKEAKAEEKAERKARIKAEREKRAKEAGGGTADAP